ncbi:MAG: sporulation transcriptional regulator SpoIIID [Ruminococcus sp.]|nr:sporulation transcriptional regulator SpoIIID [Ruminococcus sp.]
MKGIVEQRAAMLGEYIIESKSTVRSAAKKFGISKSTVHKDVSQRLRNINPTLYKEVREILNTNKNERHIRGGIATRNKYLMRKEKMTIYKNGLETSSLK